jgi:hypothetical protein
MHRFRVCVRLGLTGVLFPLLACSCSNDAPNPGFGAQPPGQPGPNDPGYKGSFEEIPTGKGGFNKKIFWNQGQSGTAQPGRRK